MVTLLISEFIWLLVPKVQLEPKLLHCAALLGNVRHCTELRRITIFVLRMPAAGAAIVTIYLRKVSWEPSAIRHGST